MSDSEVLDYDKQEQEANAEVVESTKPIDHQGLQTSVQLEPQEEVRYEIRDETSFHVTRALFIGNLRRPINAIEFQKYLKSEAGECGSVVERAWLNRTRTHAIVLVDKEEGATHIRHKLNGSLYPSEEEDSRLREEFEAKEEERYQKELQEYEDSKNNQDESQQEAREPLPARQYTRERIPLCVDYIPVKVINQWIFEEDRGPKNGQWKVEYEAKGDEILASHTLLNGDFMPHYNKHYHHPRYGRGDRRGGGYRGRYPSQPRGRGGYGGYSGYGNYGNYGNYDNYDNYGGPRPYDVYPPRTNYYGSSRRGPRDGRSRGYNSNSYDRGNDRGGYNTGDGFEERGRNDAPYRERVYDESYRERPRSRSPT